MHEEDKDSQEISHSDGEKPKSTEEVSLDYDEEESLSEEGDSQAGDVEMSVEAKKKSYDELHDRYLRLQAEFDNYRKRMSTRFEEVTQFASESILLKVLDIVDNMERALNTDFAADPESAKAGVAAINRQIEKVLQNEQVRPIESLGKEFDPYYQNAIQTVNDDNLPDKTVIQEYQKGYMYRDKVLRPAMVCVNRHIEARDTTGETEEDTEETEGEE